MDDTHEELRAKTRTHLETRGVSIAQAARSIGMSAPAVSSWLAGNYRGDNDRVARLVGRWLRTERETSDRRSRGLDRHAMLAVTDDIEDLAAQAQANRDLVLVYGTAGSGKTYALKRYCDEHSGAWFVEMSPAITTPAATLSRIARALDAAEGVTTARQLEDLVVDQLRDRDALLVVDEAHHLSTALLDQVRRVYDLAECGLVLAGNDPLRARLKAAGRAGQLLSRVGLSRRLKAATEGDVLELAETLLQREPGGEGRQAILAAARNLGQLRAVRKLVSLAGIFARADGRGSVSDEDLVLAAEKMGRDE